MNFILNLLGYLIWYFELGYVSALLAESADTHGTLCKRRKQFRNKNRPVPDGPPVRNLAPHRGTRWGGGGIIILVYCLRCTTHCFNDKAPGHQWRDQEQQRRRGARQRGPPVTTSNKK